VRAEIRANRATPEKVDEELDYLSAVLRG